MKRIYFFLVILLCATIAYAQNVTINGRERQNVDILEFSAISEPATSSTNKTRMYMDSTDGKLKCSQDGDAYEDCIGLAEGSTQIVTPAVYSSTGTLALGGIGNTNNEKISLNFESVANQLGITSATGLSSILLTDISFRLADLTSIVFGTGTDTSIYFETAGNDNLQMGLTCGSANSSGYFSLMEKGDMGNSNRSPSSTSTHPVFRVYSATQANANSYGDLYDNDLAFNIITGSPAIKLQESAGSSMQLDQDGLHLTTAKAFYLGTTRWDNGSDKIDGDQVADDTIDDDSIDFGTGADQISGLDIPLDVTNFDGILGGTDTNVQAALETIDEYSAGSGDMTQAVYDTDTNNVVDTVDSVPASAINWDSYEGTIVAGAIELSLQAGYSSSTKYYEDPANGDNFVMFQAPASLAESSTAYVDDLNKHHATVTILEPAEGDSANIYQWPAATKITNLSCIADGSTSVPYTLYECTNPTTCTIVKSLFTCGTGGVSFTTFDDDSIASGSSLIIGGGAPSGSPDGTFINVDFKVVR